MAWFMIAFIACLCIVFAYYIERQINDPGVSMFPFNGVSSYTIEPPKPAKAKKDQAE